VAIFFTQSKKNAAPSNEIIASAARILIDEFARIDQCINRELSAGLLKAHKVSIVPSLNLNG